MKYTKPKVEASVIILCILVVFVLSLIALVFLDIYNSQHDRDAIMIATGNKIAEDAIASSKVKTEYERNTLRVLHITGQGYQEGTSIVWEDYWVVASVYRLWVVVIDTTDYDNLRLKETREIPLWTKKDVTHGSVNANT